jgi:hypothetical protein
MFQGDKGYKGEAGMGGAPGGPVSFQNLKRLDGCSVCLLRLYMNEFSDELPVFV